MVCFLKLPISYAGQADLFINKVKPDRRFVMRRAIMTFTATDRGTSIWGRMIPFWSNFYKSYPDNPALIRGSIQTAQAPLLLGSLPCSPSAILCIANVNNSDAPTSPLTFVLQKHCYIPSNWQWFHVMWQTEKPRATAASFRCQMKAVTFIYSRDDIHKYWFTVPTS